MSPLRSPTDHHARGDRRGEARGAERGRHRLALLDQGSRARQAAGAGAPPAGRAPCRARAPPGCRRAAACRRCGTGARAGRPSCALPSAGTRQSCALSHARTSGRDTRVQRRRRQRRTPARPISQPWLPTKLPKAISSCEKNGSVPGDVLVHPREARHHVEHEEAEHQAADDHQDRRVDAGGDDLLAARGRSLPGRRCSAPSASRRLPVRSLALMVAT